MEIFVNLAMAIVATMLIGYPFFINKVNEELAEETVIDKKDMVFSALGEIEFDYQMKKLNDQDYRELKSGYQQKALKILETEDEELDKRFESEMNRRQQAKTPVAGEEHE